MRYSEAHSSGELRLIVGNLESQGFLNEDKSADAHKHTALPQRYKRFVFAQPSVFDTLSSALLCYPLAIAEEEGE